MFFGTMPISRLTDFEQSESWVIVENNRGQ